MGFFTKWYVDAIPKDPKVGDKQLTGFQKPDYILCAMVDELTELNITIKEIAKKMGADVS